MGDIEAGGTGGAKGSLQGVGLAPRDVLKQFGMGCGEGDKVVAAIGCGTENGVGGGIEERPGLVDVVGSDRDAIGSDGGHALEAIGESAGEGLVEASAEVAIRLGEKADFGPGLADGMEIRSEPRSDGGFAVGGVEEDVDRVCRGEGNLGKHFGNEPSVGLGGEIGTEGLGETGLYGTRGGEFEKDEEGAFQET